QFAYDGGVLEVSDGGNWVDAGALITSGGYNLRTLDCATLNPLANRQVWSGSSSGWRQVLVDLLSFRGRSVKFRFRLGTDETGVAAGWWIDDVAVAFAQSVCFSPTPTGTRPTATPTATLTVTPTPWPICTQPTSTPYPTVTP